MSCHKEVKKEPVLSEKEKLFAFKVDSVSQLLMNKYSMNPGLSVVLVKNEKVLLVKGYGVSDIKTKNSSNLLEFFVLIYLC